MKDPADLQELIELFLHNLWRDCLHLLVIFILKFKRPHCDPALETNNKDKRLENSELCSHAKPTFRSTQFSEDSIDELNSDVEYAVNYMLKFVMQVFYCSFRFGLLLCVRYPLKVKNCGDVAVKVLIEVKVGLRTTPKPNSTPTRYQLKLGSPDISHKGEQLERKAGHHKLYTLCVFLAMLAVLPVFPDDNQTRIHSGSTSRNLSFAPENVSISENYNLDLHEYVIYHPYGNTSVDVCDSPSKQSYTLTQESYCNATLSNCTATDYVLQYSASDAITFRYYFIAVCSALWSVLLMAPEFVQSRPVGQPVQDGILRRKAIRSFFRGARASERSLVVDLQGSPNTGYCAVISIGRSATQEFCVLVDTGSSNLAVAAASQSGISTYFNTQNPDNSYVSTNRQVSVTYTGGDWSGTLVRDVVSIGGSPQVEVELALITSSNKFFIPGAPWVGILGLAYESLAKPDSTVETYWSVLQRSSGLRDMFAISLCPQVGFVNQGGVMEFGDISATLYTGPILYTTVVKERYYGVLVTNMTVGDISIDLPCSEFNNDKAIVDSGTTDIYLPVKTFGAVVETFTQYFQDQVPLLVPESFWKGGSKLAWPTEDQALLYSSFPTFYVGFALHENSTMEFSLAVTPQIYLRQVSGSHDEQVETNCLPTCDFFVFGIKGRERGMVVGANVMLGFTTVFDREQKRIGFAKSTCQYEATSQDHLPHIVGPYRRDPVDCECHNCSPGLAYWEYIVYVCGGMVFPIALLSIIYAVTKKIIKKRNRATCCSSCRGQPWNRATCCSSCKGQPCCDSNCSYECVCGCKKLICVGRNNRNYRATETDDVNCTSVPSEDQPSIDQRDCCTVTNETSISSETSLVRQHSVCDVSEIDRTSCEQETFEHSIPCEEQNIEYEEHSIGIACTEHTELEYNTTSCVMSSIVERREPSHQTRPSTDTRQYVYVQGHQTFAGKSNSVFAASFNARPTSECNTISQEQVDLLPSRISRPERSTVYEDYHLYRQKKIPNYHHSEAIRMTSDC